MSNNVQNAFQFKISLAEIRPPIWRRIQVPGAYSFQQLHSAIQCAMGWEDCHLYQFEIYDPKTAESVQIGDGDNSLYSSKEKISKYFSPTNTIAFYEYDFGDSWIHKIVFEKILPITGKYPLCIAGKRACPPEDCGGTWGYEDLVNIMKNKRHKHYKERLEWLGKHFDPEDFNPKEVTFYED